MVALVERLIVAGLVLACLVNRHDRVLDVGSPASLNAIIPLTHIKTIATNYLARKRNQPKRKPEL